MVINKLILALRSFLFTFILFFSLNAKAEWINTASNTYGDVYYYEPYSVYKTEGYVIAWELVDYTKQSLVPDKPIYSVKNLLQVDCYSLKHRFLVSIYFSETGARGYVVMTDDSVSQWTANYSGSVGYTQASTLCRN